MTDERSAISVLNVDRQITNFGWLKI
jgi:hypothetical protein